MNINDIILESEPPKNNPVAKHARTFNKSSVQADRKKQQKRGYSKHKGKQLQMEAPVGLARQVARKAGAKAAGAVGAKGTAAGLSGKAETGDVARQLAVDLKKYAGQTGLNPKQLDAQDLSAFLQSKGYPTTPLSGASGTLTPKQIDQALLKSAQEKAKAGGSTAGSGVGARAKTAAPAGAGQADQAAGGQTDKGGSFLDRAQQKVSGSSPQQQQQEQPAGQQFKAGDTVTYTNKKGEEKQGEVVQVLPKKDSQGNSLVQLSAAGAKFAIPQSAIKSTKASSDPVAAVREKIKALSVEQKQKLLGMI